MRRIFGFAAALSLLSCGPGGLEGSDAGAVGPPPPVVTPKRSYSLGLTNFSAWSGGTGSGDPDPKNVSRGDCTRSFLSTGVNFAPGSAVYPTSSAKLSLICNQLLTSQVSTASSTSTPIGNGIDAMQASACPAGSIMVGLAHGNSSSVYYLHAVAPICATLSAWANKATPAQTQDGKTIGDPPLPDRTLCPQGTALTGLQAVIGTINYQLAPPMRAACTEILFVEE